MSTGNGDEGNGIDDDIASALEASGVHFEREAVVCESAAVRGGDGTPVECPCRQVLSEPPCTLAGSSELNEGNVVVDDVGLFVDACC